MRRLGFLEFLLLIQMLQIVRRVRACARFTDVEIGDHVNIEPKSEGDDILTFFATTLSTEASTTRRASVYS